MVRSSLAIPITIVAGALAGAGCSYHAGSFRGPWSEFPSQRVTLGCVDLAVGRDDRGYARGPVVEYAFGNRCDHRVELDLASLRVVSRGVDGELRPLVAYDPRRELRPLPLIALSSGSESIEYRDAYDTPAAAHASICIDVGGAVAGVARTERWLCTGGGR